jgi:undecaprenyl phosphate-alpha-L-ara4N flippase subunit ArnE
MQAEARTGSSVSLGYLLLAGAVLFRATASLCAKTAGLGSAEGGPAAIVANPWYYGQLAALILQAVCWILTLRRLPLSIAYPFTSLALVINLVTARVVFHETVQALQVAAIVIICAGVVLISWRTLRP